MKESYIIEVPFNIEGIPCLIGVTHYFKQRGNPLTWSSDLDYYGYTECEYVILDRKGYRAKWLDKKKYDHEKVCETVDNYLSECASDYY